ncbi:malonate decarboxylase holo-[acyl-carrier-protein] synthase [Bradyrhizobium daqingense]|uniref:Phosphoribosyl-dephospho-CoA transferase n=1 Tax=Bradyrhizobium daqingense TaxID=993502 RepID=A0A562KR86_9BRAD|nr:MULTISPECIES: malonate decarboxylase holo-[acyl-carrier-protein] synthase [Bradyrhizobium]MDQ8731690.1 malonate decarboxylase holo-[acyl-carrier-protein] synthase [Bradyrhizobium sp. LHD-71]TWH97912.1 phosphoribosyl-dephospho-CoA transferase [Bradyrhizobium daqingense]UFS91584.1 malonate decarboxylase holo-[acyl-carrier-protein] synthase [Bradyrhizobium daqingense]
MISPCKSAERPAGRHDLVFVSPKGWRAMLEPHGELACDPLVLYWAELGWPTIRRRALPSEATGLALGLPLPPSAGKKRLSFLAGRDDIIAVARPPSLRKAHASAPPCWRPTLDRLEELALRHSTPARAFGSLAWQAMTGLDYVTASSDLDLLFETRPETDLDRLVADLAAIEIEAPMRLDGELMRADGAAVNWREFYAGASELLVKSLDGVALLNRDQFISGATGS